MRDSSNIRMIGGWPFGRIKTIIPVSDSIIYLNGACAGYIMKVSDPRAITKIDSFSSGLWFSVPHQFSIVDTLLLGSESKAGLTLYNIKQETEPTVISNYLTPDFPVGCVFIPPYAYVACYEAGLRIIDYSNPYQPVEIGVLSLPFTTYDVKVRDSFAYVVNWLGGFNVIDISDPVHPVLIFNHHLSRPALSIAIQDTIALIAWHNSGLRIWNIANPRQPFEVCSIPEPLLRLG